MYFCFWWLKYLCRMSVLSINFIFGMFLKVAKLISVLLEIKILVSIYLITNIFKYVLEFFLIQKILKEIASLQWNCFLMNVNWISLRTNNYFLNQRALHWDLPQDGLFLSSHVYDIWQIRLWTRMSSYNRLEFFPSDYKK